MCRGTVERSERAGLCPLLWTQGPLPVSHSQGQIYEDSLPLSLLPISNMKDLSTYLPLLGREGNSTKYGLAHQTGSGSIHVPPFVGSTSCLVAQTDSSISLGISFLYPIWSVLEFLLERYLSLNSFTFYKLIIF